MDIQTQNNKYHAFYDMVEKWTINDFCTQGIKAEVIIDMLISEFIEELFYLWLQLRKEAVKIENIQLLAKEFPIAKHLPIKGFTPLDNAKVDYLVINRTKKYIYITELKTTKITNNSQQNQLSHYKNYQKNVTGKKLFWFFSRIIKNSKLEPFFLKNPSKMIPINLEGSQKYITTVSRISEILGIPIKKIEDIDKLTEAFKNYKVKVIYINLKRYTYGDKKNSSKKSFEEKFEVPEIVLEELLVPSIEGSKEYTNFERLLKQRGKYETWNLTKELLLNLLR